MLLQAGYAYRSIAQFVKHVTKRTTCLGNFPFPDLYKEVASKESACDPDSELVKITRNESEPKPGSARFRKKPKDKSSKECVAEKGDEDPAASVSGGHVFSSSDDVSVVVGGKIDVGETDKEEGTSSVSQVCVVVSGLHSFLTVI